MAAPLIAPSILSADFGRFADEVRAVDAAGADWIHIDVMDGRFVPTITFGPDVVSAVRRATAKPLNAHLMIVEPERFIDAFVKSGADSIVVQAEPSSTIHLHRVLSRIKDAGKQAGVALNPATPPSAVEYVLPLLDIVLVMTVDPGFGGQNFLAGMLPKIRVLKGMCRELGLNPSIEVDGGINLETIGPAVEAGADVCVAGSFVFGAQDYGAAIRGLRERGHAARRHTETTP